jgi:deoxyadenosine/deoxycytidine kinase
MLSSLNIKIVSIEGNIGSGKSTLLENLKKHYINNENVIFLKEPVDDWEKIKDVEGNTILKKFYENQEKYSFPFQMMAYISRLKILRDCVQQLTNTNTSANNPFIIITERSLYTDKYVFAKMLYDQGKIEDVCYQIYLNWFDEFSKDFTIENSIYVNTEPEKCYERVHKRAREGEEFIPLTYLQECHNYHEDFINNTYLNKLALNGNIDIYENEKVIKEWIQQIENYIN